MLDAYKRKIVGGNFIAHRVDTLLALAALRSAVQTRHLPSELREKPEKIKGVSEYGLSNLTSVEVCKDCPEEHKDCRKFSASYARSIRMHSAVASDAEKTWANFVQMAAHCVIIRRKARN